MNPRISSPAEVMKEFLCLSVQCKQGKLKALLWTSIRVTMLVTQLKKEDRSRRFSRGRPPFWDYGTRNTSIRPPNPQL